MLFSASMAEAQSSKSGTIRLTAGSTTSSSGAYIWAVAIVRAINKYAPGINVTLVESGATYDNLRRIREGVFDLGLADGWHGPLELYRGLETFEGKGWKEIRILFFRDPSPCRTYVRADSGIKMWSDLKGKRLHAGQPGSAAAQRVMRANELLGTGAVIVPGALGDAANQLQIGRVDAVHKSGPADTFDALLLEAHLMTPLSVIGFSDEEAAKISVRYPQFLVAKTAAGSIKPVPKLGSLWEIVTLGVSSTSSRLPQDVGYRMTKAVYEHWKEIGQAFPACASYDPIMDYVRIVPKGNEVPIQAGVIQYAKERGIKIPASLIPPEYKEK